ncbi:MAG: RNA polymerase sigma factor RpoD/SigA [Vicinamibacterales bacterium]|nr:RNA polymerase sigma factor RpoD/SigA [Vicinamibacterales bacterium]
MPRRRIDPAAETQTLRAYLHEIARVPRLSPDEEHALAVVARQGDEAALRRLVEANLRFVVSYAKRYRGLGVPFLDLIHEGNLGLIEAARRFDPERQVKFITYAVWWVRQAILHTLSDQIRIVSLPVKLSGPASRLAAHVTRLSAELHRPPTTHELAQDLDISDGDADALLHIRGDDVSLSDPVGKGDDDREFGDLLPQATVPAVDVALLHEAALDQLRRAIQELEPREREVMELRFGLGGHEASTLQEIGDRLGLSRERIRQIESRAKEKLRRNRRLSGVLSSLN